MNQEILEKIQKLLAKAGSTNSEAESTAFFAKASELMTKHGIEAHHLASAKQEKPDDTVTEQRMEGKWNSERPSHVWVRMILHECFNVMFVQTRFGRERSYTMIGTKEDMAFAQYAFSVLEEAFNKLWRARLKKFGADRLPRAERNGYYAGLRQGFTTAFKEAQQAEIARQNANSYALVLVDRKAAVTKYVQQKTNVRMKQVQRSQNRGAYEDGYHDGRNIRIARPLGAGASQTARLAG